MTPNECQGTEREYRRTLSPVTELRAKITAPLETRRGYEGLLPRRRSQEFVVNTRSFRNELVMDCQLPGGLVRSCRSIGRPVQPQFTQTSAEFGDIPDLKAAL